MTLRERMTKEIEHSDWLDWEWNRTKTSDIRWSHKTYAEYLNSLSDSVFLTAYNRIIKYEAELD